MADLLRRAGQPLKFALVGVLNTGLTYVLFLAGLRVGLSINAALAVGYAIGVVHSYLWNRYWTFKSSGSHTSELPKFVVVNLVMYGVNAAMLHGLVATTGLKPAIAQAACLVVTTGLSYLGQRWTFRPAVT